MLAGRAYIDLTSAEESDANHDAQIFSRTCYGTDMARP
jgi:hypothetical protein